MSQTPQAPGPKPAQSFNSTEVSKGVDSGILANSQPDSVTLPSAQSQTPTEAQVQEITADPNVHAAQVPAQSTTVPAEPMKRTYKDAINALNTLQSNFATVEAYKKLGPSINRSEFSLREVYEYTRRLGYSPRDFNRLNVIHVTGTKGKGSTSAFTESIVRQYADKEGPFSKVGLYISPHLKSVRERIRINGSPITELKFTKYFFEVWDKLSSTTSSSEEFPTLQPSDTVKPMYFKYLTVLSFHVFMQEGVDTAIYEVGVGGQFDSTNVFEKPTVTGISSLGIDHTAMLGNTIESITWNKTGIFKPGVPAVVSEQIEYPESLETIKSRAEEKQVSSLEIVSPEQILPEGIILGLAGEFQKQNAALAVKLSELHLRKLGFADSELPKYNSQGAIEELPDKFIKGLADVQWDGRCQKIENKPGFEKITWYIDGAHTLESINVASQWFKQEQLQKSGTPASKNLKILLFNQQSRENAVALLAKLYENISVTEPEFRFDHVIFTTNITWSNGKYNADLVSLNTSKEAVDELVIQKGLAQTWADLDSKNKNSSRKHIFHDIETGVNFIKSLSTSNDYSTTGVDVFVCGSLHLVGGFLVVLDNERAES